MNDSSSGAFLRSSQEDGKKVVVHVATPHPSKKPDAKSVGSKSNQKSPTSTADGAHSCKSCNRNFKTGQARKNVIVTEVYAETRGGKLRKAANELKPVCVKKGYGAELGRECLLILRMMIPLIQKQPCVEDKFVLKSNVAHDCMHEGAGISTSIHHNVLEGANIITWKRKLGHDLRYMYIY
ncbi:hypothetical protein Tco_1279782 [Tanacetum coccineum]